MTAMLAILRRAAGKPIDEQQASWDLIAIIRNVPIGLVRRGSQGKGTGRGRRPHAVRIVAEWTRPVWWAHTGHGRQRRVSGIGTARSYGGALPALIQLLTEAAGYSCTMLQAHNACKDFEKTLNRKVRLPVRVHQATAADVEEQNRERDATRDAILKPHVAGYVDDSGEAQSDAGSRTPLGIGLISEDGTLVAKFISTENDAVIGGYEPASDPRPTAAEIFKHLETSD